MVRKATKQEMGEDTKITEEEKVTVVPKLIAPEGWVPKTKLGRAILEGKITDINQLFADGIKITEAGIVDVLLPNLENEIIFIGGSTGKGGGIRRTPSKRTTRMHKSGRRYRISIMAVVGNKNGYIGISLASGPPGKYREVYQKAIRKAKLNIIPISRGCGSWECNCGGHHSIPFRVRGKSGSVTIELIPAPKGIGLTVSNEVKKLMRLAGINDIWCKTRGNTRARVNLTNAAFNGLKKLNSYRVKEKLKDTVGLKIGKVD